MYRYLSLLLFSALILNASCLQYKNAVESGECYEKEGNFNRAQAAYERAIINDVNSSVARLKLASLYKHIQMQENSKLILNEIDRTQLTPAQQSSLKTLETSSANSLNSFKARATLEAGYDTNVNISPNDTVTHDHNSSLQEQASAFSRLRADLSYLNDLGSSNGWFLRGDLNVYYQNNFSAHDYDLFYGRIYAGAGYRRENYTFYLPLFYDRMNYLDKDLLQEYGVRPDFTVRIIKNLFLNINANYTKRQYIQPIDTFRNDQMISGGAGLFWIDNKVIVYIKTRYEDFSATEELFAAYTNKTRLFAQAGLLYTFADILDVQLDYQYRYEDFEEIVSLDPDDTKRDDSNHDAKATLKYRFTKRLKATGSYHYIKNSSTYKLAEYQKHEMLVGLEYNY